MIYNNMAPIGFIFYNDRPVLKIYKKGKLIWLKSNFVIPEEVVTLILSCFSNGYWDDASPWTDDTPWTD